MKFIPANPGGASRLELTRRNLTTLLAKLDDPLSKRTLKWGSDAADEDNLIIVKAVEDEEHYSDRPPGEVYMPSEQKFL